MEQHKASNQQQLSSPTPPNHASPSGIPSPSLDRIGGQNIAAEGGGSGGCHQMTNHQPDDTTTASAESTPDHHHNEETEKAVAMAMAMAEEDRIVLNIGGRKFEMLRSTLQNYPDTLLGTMFHPRNRSLLRTVPGTTNEFFLDRDAEMAALILNFYRTGRVFVPPLCSLEAIKSEMDYFQIPRSFLRHEPQGEVLVLVIIQQTSRFGGFVQELHVCDRTGKKLVNWCPGSIAEDSTVAIERSQMLIEEMNVLLAQGWQLKSLNSDQHGTPTCAVFQKL